MSEKFSYSEDFIAYQQNFVMCSKFTVDRYKSLFRTLHVNNDWCSSMDYEEARDIICSFIDKGIKPSSVNVYLSMLKKFFNYLVLRSCVQYNPFQRIKRLKQPSLMPKFISYLDVRKIYDYKWNDSPLDKEDKFCIHMLLDYGLTVSELCFLKVKNINIENKSIGKIPKKIIAIQAIVGGDEGIFMVEMRGFEPLSNILSIYTSPSSVCYLTFLIKHINKQPYFISSYLKYPLL